MGISRATIAFVVLATNASQARAEDSPPEAPWQVGVTDEQRATAQTELERGNAFYGESRYEDALAAYRAGLAAWDHPSIRFNVATTLIALDRPVEAQAELELAMRFGERPLKEQWREALTYRALLARQVGTLTVSCTQPGVEIELDGKLLARCPTTHQQRVRGANYTLTAHKAGHLSRRERVFVAGGATQSLEIQLTSLSDATVTRTRWASWKPWTVAGVSAGVSLLGLGLALNARSLAADYENGQDACGELGCNADQQAALEPLWDRAVLRDRAGVTMMILGAAGLTAGVVLLVLNRPYSEVPREEVVVTPIVQPEMTGAGVVGRF